MTAIATAPALGFWVYHHGWITMCLEIAVLNLIMTVIAWRLPHESRDSRDVPAPAAGAWRSGESGVPARDVTPRGLGSLIEWRVIVLGVTLGLIAFGTAA